MTDGPETQNPPPRASRRSLWLSKPWERAASQALGTLNIHSIKAKIVIFALLATLIPSVSTAWMANRQSARSIREKIDEELRNAASQSARETDLWLRQREYDVRVLSSRNPVYDFLMAATTSATRPAESMERLARVREFLTSVHGRIEDYEELLVLDAQGRVLVSTSAGAGDVSLPEGWEAALGSDRGLIGEPYRDPRLQRNVIVIVVPVRLGETYDGTAIGMLAGKVKLDALRRILMEFSSPEGETSLVTPEGEVVLSSRARSGPGPWSLDPAVREAMLSEDRTTVRYTDWQGQAVIGMTGVLPELHWGTVAAVPETVAFARVRELRRTTMLIVIVLLVVVALIAYYLALLIVRPLDRLTAGASIVAGGNLAVDLPVVGEGEVGYLTRMFNDMVARLRQGRQELDAINEELRTKNLELERQSITDGLTGLYNRRHFMETLLTECRRAARSKREFAILMIDVDHFKQFNDTHGHLAGDEALAHVATVLKDLSRDADCVARYGGEEFLLLLPETDLDGAAVLGDRIRARLVEDPLTVGGVGTVLTVSAGVAAYPTHGEDPEGLIARADEALYAAKKKGRDRVVAASRRQRKRKTSA